MPTDNKTVIGLAIRHPHYAPAQRRMIAGRPHVHYALKSLQDSGLAKAIYFISADDKEMDAAANLGCRIIPWAGFNDSSNIRGDLARHVNSHIAREAGVDADQGVVPAPGSLPGVHCVFRVDCNLCLLTRDTMRGMLRRLEETAAPVLYAASRMEDRIGLAGQDWQMQRLLYDPSQDYYQDPSGPGLLRFFPETRLDCPRHGVTGRPLFHYSLVPRTEELYVHDGLSTFFAEQYLERHPGHFGPEGCGVPEIHGDEF